MGIEMEYPLGYASSGGILYFVTPAIFSTCKDMSKICMNLPSGE